MMIRNLFITGMALFVVGAPSVRADDTRAKSPLVVTDSESPSKGTDAVYNFGTYKEGFERYITHTFTIKNTSAKAVTLKSIEAACQCSSAKFDNAASGGGTTMQPGKSATVKMSLDVAQLPTGRMDKLVWVFIEGMKKPALILHMAGSMEQTLWFNPMVMDFNTVSVDSHPARQLIVTYDKDVFGGTADKMPISTDSDLSIQPEGGIAKVSEGRFRQAYKVTLNPHGHIGRLVTDITLPMPSIHGSESVLVTGSVVGDLVAKPYAHSFTTVAVGSSASTDIEVSGRTPNALAGLSITPDDPALSYKLIKQTGKSATIRVTVSPTKPGALLSHLNVSTKSGETLHILVSAWVQ